jgi:AcrR family transcriptional regulator
VSRPANPDLVDRIVRVTAGLIDDEGIERVTIRRVADEAGCSPTVIYHYFGNKDGLLHRAVQQGLDWFGSFVQTSEQGLHGVDRVRASARSYVQWGVRNPSMYRLMFEQRLPRSANPEELKKRRGSLDSARDMLGKVFSENGVHVDRDQAANIFFVTLHGVVSATISGRLWGPGLDEDVLLESSVPLTDALVDQWAVAWGLSK